MYDYNNEVGETVTVLLINELITPFCVSSNYFDQQICNERMERGPGCVRRQREPRGGRQSAFISWSGGEGQAQLWWNRGHQFDRGTQTGEGAAPDRPPEVQTGDRVCMHVSVFFYRCVRLFWELPLSWLYRRMMGFSTHQALKLQNSIAFSGYL